MRFVIFYLTFCFLIYGDSIKEQEKHLSEISAQRNNISKKLKTLGEQINVKNAKIKQLDKEIALLQNSIGENQKLYLKEEVAYKELAAQKENLSLKRNKLQDELIQSVLKEMAILMMISLDEPISENSIMSEEVLKLISSDTSKKINSLSMRQKLVTDEMKSIDSKLKNAKKVILLQQERKSALEGKKNEHQTLSAKMQNELKVYNNELIKLDKERESINKVLVELKILKQKQSQGDQSVVSSDIKPPINVRQIGSTYRPVNTAKYYGSKTIPPLRDYTIATKYGQYIDPVYNMKVFNEFVTFSVKKRSAVLSVLDGKVVFAKDTSFAKKMLVVENQNGIHTIFSYLDSIPSSIKVGTKVKKGTILAYINDRLNFEVTMKDKHINPLDLIKTK